MGDDATARVWSADGHKLQELRHGGSIFSVKVLPNGDFVTASSDHVARIFTRSRARVGSEELLKSFAELSQLVEAAGGGIEQVDESKFPGQEALKTPGMHSTCFIHCHMFVLFSVCH